MGFDEPTIHHVKAIIAVATIFDDGHRAAVDLHFLQEIGVDPPQMSIHFGAGPAAVEYAQKFAKAINSALPEMAKPILDLMGVEL